jgi:hypothetical protein
MTPATRNLLNFVAFQIAWFACVLGGANDHVVAGTLVVAAARGPAFRDRAAPGPEAAPGRDRDDDRTRLGQPDRLPRLDELLRPGVFAPGVAPVWIVAMWALFATTLNVSMSWLKGRPWLAAAFGATAAHWLTSPAGSLAASRLLTRRSRCSYRASAGP